MPVAPPERQIFRDAVVRMAGRNLRRNVGRRGCAACPCRGSGSCATRPDRRAGRDRCGRACRRRTARASPARRACLLRSIWMRSISARDFGSGERHRSRPRPAARQQCRSSAAARRRFPACGRRSRPLPCAASARFLRRRDSRDRVERVAQHRLVVGADRADIGASAAAGDDAGAAQNALPEIEAVLRAHQLLLRLAASGSAMMRVDVLGQLRESRAASGSGSQASQSRLQCPTASPGQALRQRAAGRAEAERLLHLLVAGDIDRAEHRGQHHARPVFGREQLQVEPERAEARPRPRHAAATAASSDAASGSPSVAPGIDMGRRHDDRRIAVVLEPVDQLERGFLQPRQRQLVVVVFVAVVPGRDARDAARSGASPARSRGRRRCSVMSEGRCGSRGSGGWRSSAAPSAMPTRSAPSARAFALMSARGERLLEDRDHQRVHPRRRAPAGVRCALACCFLELLQLARHHALVALRPDPADVPVVQPRDRRRPARGSP